MRLLVQLSPIERVPLTVEINPSNHPLDERYGDVSTGTSGFAFWFSPAPHNLGVSKPTGMMPSQAYCHLASAVVLRAYLRDAPQSTSTREPISFCAILRPSYSDRPGGSYAASRILGHAHCVDNLRRCGT